MTPAASPDPPPRFGGGVEERPDRAELLAAKIHWPDGRIAARDLTTLSGVGQTFRKQAEEAGVETVGQLLWRVPRAYGQRPGTSLLGDLEPGEATGVEVRIIRSRKVRTRRRKFSLVEARVADDSGARKAVWFNQPWMADKLTAESNSYLEGRLETVSYTQQTLPTIA